MPSPNLLALFDDVAAMMDDVAVMTKKATSKTLGLIGDDLAVNSEQMIGLKSTEEFKVVFKIFWGALLNKAVLIPIILWLTYSQPQILKWVLFIGGLYLCYEGFEKVEEKLLKKIFNKKAHIDKKKSATVVPKQSLDKRIKGAIKTDFILSAEILAIAASTLTGEPLWPMVITLTLLAIGVNLVIYGTVLIIIRLDDLGLTLLAKNYNFALNKLGRGLIASSPKIMKCLGFIGTVATLLVGGGIFQHTFHLTMGLNSILENFIFGLGVGFIVWSLIVGIMIAKQKLSKET